ncbi:MAG: hypothetical protein ACXU82_00010 [Caulobacteraceae bacterium]
MPGKFTSYTIRILGQGGDIVCAMSLICADDHDVQLAAQIMSHPYGMEIWDGDRRVAALPPAAKPAKAA